MTLFSLVRNGLLSGLMLTAAATVFAPTIGKAAPEKPRVWLAQSADSYRINELEEQIRQLNGKVEDLTFQLFEMKEQMRRMQEDYELRFQELEEKRSDRGGSRAPAVASDNSETDRLGKSEPSAPQGADGNDRETETAVTGESDTRASVPLPAPSSGNAPERGAPPRALGTLTFDENGNVIDARPAEGADGTLAKLPLPGIFSDGVDGGVEAAEFGPTPAAVFAVGKTALENRRFERAEAAFRAYLKAWPNDPRDPEARFHLAEALFWKKDYYNAANIHLDTHNAHPRAKTAAENLLGLGLALAGLNQREVACATYAEVLKQYPQAAGRLADRVAAEQASARC